MSAADKLLARLQEEGVEAMEEFLPEMEKAFKLTIRMAVLLRELVKSSGSCSDTKCSVCIFCNVRNLASERVEHKPECLIERAKALLEGGG